MLVWNDLIKLHQLAGWRSGIYEKEHAIRTTFELSNDLNGIFYYMVYDRDFYCRVKIIEDFPDMYASDLFILASHFNNLLVHGVVVVNVEDHYVEYLLKREWLVPLLYRSELYEQIVRHHNTSKDIHWAFQRLIAEDEAPAIIIADLLRRNEASDNESK